MGTKVHLNVRFKEDAPFQKRGIFIASLRKDDWQKSPGEEYCWTATFKADVTDEAAMNVIKHDVDRASKKADILSYEALVKLGEGPQNTFGPFYSDKHLSSRADRKQEPEKWNWLITSASCCHFVAGTAYTALRSVSVAPYASVMWKQMVLKHEAW